MRNYSAARTQFERLAVAARTEHEQRVVVRAGVSAVEGCRRLRFRAHRVAAAHLWSAVVPPDRPRGFVARDLVTAFILAAPLALLGDKLLTPAIPLLQRGTWRVTVWVAVWNVLTGVLHRLFERRRAAAVRAAAATMTFERARALVAAELSHAPDGDPHVPRALAAAEARLGKPARVRRDPALAGRNRGQCPAAGRVAVRIRRLVRSTHAVEEGAARSVAAAAGSALRLLASARLVQSSIHPRRTIAQALVVAACWLVLILPMRAFRRWILTRRIEQLSFARALTLALAAVGPVIDKASTDERTKQLQIVRRRLSAVESRAFA